MNAENKVKIGDLNFELLIPQNEEEAPSFEIENDASMVFVKVDEEKAVELRDLLNTYIEEMNKNKMRVTKSLPS